MTRRRALTGHTMFWRMVTWGRGRLFSKLPGVFRLLKLKSKSKSKRRRKVYSYNSLSFWAFSFCLACQCFLGTQDYFGFPGRIVLTVRWAYCCCVLKCVSDNSYQLCGPIHIRARVGISLDTSRHHQPSLLKPLALLRSRDFSSPFTQLCARPA